MTSAKYEAFDNAFHLFWQVRAREDEVKLAYQVPGFAARLLAWLGGLSRPTLYSENWPLHGDQVAALRADSFAVALRAGYALVTVARDGATH